MNEGPRKLVAADIPDTARLAIRSVREADLAALLDVNDNAEVNHFLPYARWQGMADANAWFQRMQALQVTGTAIQYVIIGHAQARAIGSVLLFHFDAGSARAELGYVLGRQYWGQGFMREALTAVIDSAFGPLRLRRLEAEVNPDNQASVRLLRSVGFRCEGLLRERWVTNGVAHDVELHGLLGRDWRNRD